ncbi:MAG TPA: DUF309 domain-containing protein [Candidatus Dormibacteraeota bacterium]|nr:DUF309 domain-containing protein [Candidatus Dormibacteraeota bacterium]
MAEPTTKPAPKRRSRNPATAAEAPAAASAVDGDLPRGRTPPLEEAAADELFRRGVALFNGVRYWHAHEAWEDLWRAAPEDERDFYQGLIQLAAGLLHLERRNPRGARNLLSSGIARLRKYQPTHRGIFVNELVGRGERILEDLESGFLPYLIPPVIRFVELDQSDFDR